MKSHPDWTDHRRPPVRFLPLRKVYWFRIRTSKGKEINLPKWSQNWSVSEQRYLDYPCPYASLAQRYGYQACNATDALQLSGRQPAESMAFAIEEARKLEHFILPGPLAVPAPEGFTDGAGI